MKSMNIDKSKLLSFVPLLAVCVVVGCAFFAPDVYAGDGGQEFEDVWTTLKDWTQGTLGRIIAIALVLVGIVFGVASQSLIAFAICIAGAMGLYQSPAIIEALLTADGTEFVEQFQVISVDHSSNQIKINN